jgi:hypothetical protein
MSHSEISSNQNNIETFQEKCAFKEITSFSSVKSKRTKERDLLTHNCINSVDI